MTPEEFKSFGVAALDFVAKYLSADCKNIPVVSSVESGGYLHKLLPNQMSDEPENWTDVLEDFKTKIMPGITHWQSPHFHAYYPTQTSFPSVIGEILSGGLGIVGFNWIASPACTELEVIVLDWLAKYLNLPSKFQSQEGQGGGVIQGSASEAILVAILASREAFNVDNVAKLVMYASDQSNCCVEKNARIAGVKCRLLKTEEDGILTGKILEEAIALDINRGYVPCICVATMGTTGICSFDAVEELANVCQRYKMFIHVDAAYAGAASCLPEFNHHADAFKHVHSLNFNLHKMMNVNFDCCAMWLSDTKHVVDAFNVDRIYMKNITEDSTKWTPDFRHWQIPLGRRFRALKVWITLRIMGAANIRVAIRNRYELAEYFNSLLETDDRIEVVHKARFGLLTFRLKSGNEATKQLLERLNQRKNIFLTPIIHSNTFLIRFVVGGFDPKREDMKFAFNEINGQI